MARQTARELRLYPDEDGCIVIRARLPAEAGAVVLEALEAAMAVQRAGESRFAQCRADALATLAETTLRHGGEALSSAERHRVVMHVAVQSYWCTFRFR